MKHKPTFLFKIAILALLLIFSTNIFAQKRLHKKNKKRIVGTWVLENVEIGNSDEVATKQMELYHDIINQQIASLKQQIEGIEDEEEKANLQAQIDEFNAEKLEYTKEKIIEEWDAMFEESLGEIELTFTKDGKAITGDETSEWHISEDGKTLILETETNQNENEFIILELNKQQLILFIEEGEDENLMKFKMTFKKE